MYEKKSLAEGSHQQNIENEVILETGWSKSSKEDGV